MDRERRKPSFTSLAAFFLVVTPILYVLSYAPVVRFCGPPLEYQPPMVGPGNRATVYRLREYRSFAPVDWLIDNTPLKEPFFLWADLWGIREAFRQAALAREHAGHTRMIDRRRTR